MPASELLTDGQREQVVAALRAGATLTEAAALARVRRMDVCLSWVRGDGGSGTEGDAAFAADARGAVAAYRIELRSKAIEAADRNQRVSAEHQRLLVEAEHDREPQAAETGFHEAFARHVTEHPSEDVRAAARGAQAAVTELFERLTMDPAEKAMLDRALAVAG